MKDSDEFVVEAVAQSCSEGVIMKMLCWGILSAAAVTLFYATIRGVGM